MARPLFANRADAGRRLADVVAGRLAGVGAGAAAVVLALPRGGVPVAGEVAGALHAPLDVIVVRKLGAPGQPELAVGAIGEDGLTLIDGPTADAVGVDAATLAAIEVRERAELERRAATLRVVRPPVSIAGRTAVVVDDGLATGSTARAACRVVRARGAARIVLAVPVGPAATVAYFDDADEVVCLATPHPFVAVGVHYRDFAPTSEAEVIAILRAGSQPG